MDRAPKTVCVAIIRKGLTLGLPSEDKHCWIVSAEFGDTTAGSKPVYLISSGIRPTCCEALPIEARRINKINIKHVTKFARCLFALFFFPSRTPLEYPSTICLHSLPAESPVHNFPKNRKSACKIADHNPHAAYSCRMHKLRFDPPAAEVAAAAAAAAQSSKLLPILCPRKRTHTPALYRQPPLPAMQTLPPARYTYTYLTDGNIQLSTWTAPPASYSSTPTLP